MEEGICPSSYNLKYKEEKTMAKKIVEEGKVKKDKSNKEEKSNKGMDVEKAIINILASLETIEKKLAKMGKKLDTVADDTVDVFNLLQEVSEGLDLDSDSEDEDEDEDDE
jgi:hypothetical protein